MPANTCHYCGVNTDGLELRQKTDGHWFCHFAHYYEWLQFEQKYGRGREASSGAAVSECPPGSKYDQEKARWDLMPLLAEKSVIDVLTFGSRKYSDDNWRKVTDLERRYYRAAMGHIKAWRRGEAADKESTLPHLAHAICCLLFILETELTPRVEGGDNIVK